MKMPAIRRSAWLHALFLTALALGPARSEPVGSADEGRPLVALTGSASAVEMPEMALVADRATWRALWDRHAGGGGTPVALAPDVDFSRCEVLALFAGNSVNVSGMRVVSLNHEGARRVLRYELRSYQTNNTRDATTPFAFFVLARSTRPLLVQEDVQRSIVGEPVWETKALLQPPGRPPR